MLNAVIPHAIGKVAPQVTPPQHQMKFDLTMAEIPRKRASKRKDLDRTIQRINHA